MVILGTRSWADRSHSKYLFKSHRVWGRETYLCWDFAIPIGQGWGLGEKAVQRNVMEIRSKKEYSPVAFFSVVWHALAYLCLGNLINQSPPQFIGLLKFSLECPPPHPFLILISGFLLLLFLFSSTTCIFFAFQSLTLWKPMSTKAYLILWVLHSELQYPVFLPHKLALTYPTYCVWNRWYFGKCTRLGVQRGLGLRSSTEQLFKYKRVSSLSFNFFISKMVRNLIPKRYD